MIAEFCLYASIFGAFALFTCLFIRVLKGQSSRLLDKAFFASHAWMVGWLLIAWITFIAELMGK